jgi:hypothetical protein
VPCCPIGAGATTQDAVAEVEHLGSDQPVRVEGRKLERDTHRVGGRLQAHMLVLRAGIAIDLAARRLTRERYGGQLIDAVLGPFGNRHGAPTKLQHECGHDAMTLASFKGL